MEKQIDKNSKRTLAIRVVLNSRIERIRNKRDAGVDGVEEMRQGM